MHIANCLIYIQYFQNTLIVVASSFVFNKCFHNIIKSAFILFIGCQKHLQIIYCHNTKERETRAFAKLNAYIPNTKCILITNSEEATLDYDGIQIEIVPIWKWLLDS